MKKKVLVIGSSNMDLSLNVYKIPAAGETIIDDGGVAYTPGGKGANAAIALAKLGATTVFCTKLGADVHGQQLYKFYRDNGLDTVTTDLIPLVSRLTTSSPRASR